MLPTKERVIRWVIVSFRLHSPDSPVGREPNDFSLLCLLSMMLTSPSIRLCRHSVPQEALVSSGFIPTPVSRGSEPYVIVQRQHTAG